MAIELASAYVTIIPSLQGAQAAISSQLIPAAAAGGISAGTASGAGMLAAFGKAVAPLAGIFAGVFAVTAITDYISDAIQAAANWEVINAQTEARIKSTGGSARVSAGQIHEMAQSLEAVTATQAESIQEGANLLLSFKSIRNEAGEGNNVFDRSVATMVDLARAMGTDTTSAALQLGKALENPSIGLTALRRSGVSFTESQVDLIKSLVESGNQLEAQKIILNEVNSQFGGSGAAYASTLSGQLYLLGDAFGDVGEGIATSFLPLFKTVVAFLKDNVVPAFAQVGQGISLFLDAVFVGRSLEGTPLASLAPVATAVRERLDDIGAAIGRVFSAIGEVGGAIIARLFGLDFSNQAASVASSIDGVVGSINGVADWLIQNKDSIASGVKSIADAFGAFVKFMVDNGPNIGKSLEAVGTILPIITNVITFITNLVNWFGQLLNIGANFSNFINTVVTGWNGLVAMVTASVGAIAMVVAVGWNTVVSVVSGAVSAVIGFVTGLVGSILGFIGGLVGNVISFFISMWEGASRAVSDGINAVISFVGSLPGRIFDALSGAANWLFDIGKDIINGLINGARAVIDTVISTFTGMANDIINSVKNILGIKSPSRVFREIGVDVGLGFIEGIDSMADKIDTATTSMVTIPSRPASSFVTSSTGAGLTEPQGNTFNVYTNDPEEAANMVYRRQALLAV